MTTVLKRPEHNYRGNCCAPLSSPPSDECADHGQWRGECPFCPPCEACDLEWAESKEAQEEEAQAPAVVTP